MEIGLSKIYISKKNILLFKTRKKKSFSQGGEKVLFHGHTENIITKKESKYIFLER